MENASDIEEENDKKKKDALLLAAHLNMALCYLKQGEQVKAENSCDAALALDKDNVKAYFRRGQVHPMFISDGDRYILCLFQMGTGTSYVYFRWAQVHHMFIS